MMNYLNLNFDFFDLVRSSFDLSQIAAQDLEQILDAGILSALPSHQNRTLGLYF